MPCEHIRKLNDFVVENKMDISSMELLRIVCTRCKIKHECPSMPVEYFEKMKGR